MRLSGIAEEADHAIPGSVSAVVLVIAVHTLMHRITHTVFHCFDESAVKILKNKKHGA